MPKPGATLKATSKPVPKPNLGGTSRKIPPPGKSSRATALGATKPARKAAPEPTLPIDEPIEELEPRGNVVAPVAGEMVIAGEDDRTGKVRRPTGQFEEEATLAFRPGQLRPSGGDGGASSVLEAYNDEAKGAIAQYREDLAEETDPQRVGRFHYEIGRLYDTVVGDFDAAAEHYGKALGLIPSHLPTIVGARRVMLERGEHIKALDLFDRELRVTADRGAKAGLMFAKARVLEDKLNRIEDARKVYASATELIAADPVALKALELADWKRSEWSQLAETYGRSANAVGGDPKHRAALVVRRARLLEVRDADPDAAAELYEDALGIDHRAPGALPALGRLHYDRRRWRELIRVLETETDTTSDAQLRVMAMYRIGQLHGERLGNRKEAIAAMEAAGREAPDTPFVLDALSRLYERAGSHPALAATLARLAKTAEDPREQIGFLHRIGELSRDELHDDDAAIRAYEAALGLDASYVPALRALAPMYAEKKKWDELVAMHEAEADAVSDRQRRAVAHARAGEILERVGRKVEAIRHHERALSLDPQFGASFRALIRLYTLTADHHKLIELYERGIERVDQTRTIEYLFAIGDLYRGPLDDPEQAEGSYRRVLKLDPKHLGAVHAIQRTAEAAARWKQLVEALEAEVEMITDKAEIVTLLHRAGEVLHEQLNNRVAAVSRFKRVLQIESHHRATLASLGRIYAAEGHWADLVEIYSRELQISSEAPSKVALLHKMGEVHTRFLAETEKAIACFKRALKIQPYYTPAANALARIYADQQRWKELVALVESEREHARNDTAKSVAAFRAGEIYEEHLDELASAEACYAQAAELRPGDRAVAEALARARTHLKKWKELCDDLERRAQETQEPEAAINLLLRAGEVAWDRIDDAARAINAYERVLSLNPNHLGALLAVESLYAGQRAWPELADVYVRQVRVFGDAGAKAAALTERARILERHGIGGAEELVQCYTQILGFRPADRGALEGLERVALRTADPALLADVDARLNDAVADPELKAAFLTRQAEALEASGQPQALEIYRTAIELDANNRGAIRGLRRLAEILGNGIAMVEAAEYEAALAKNPRKAADAWVRAGTVQADHLEDTEAAVAAFEKALGLWPDHEDAATRLTELLTRSGDFEVLVERLSRAAADATEDARQSALSIDVARLHAQELANVGAALSALHRLIEAQPKNPAALFELGNLYVEERRHEEAIEMLDRCATARPPLELMRDVQGLLGDCQREAGNAKKAFRHYERALELAPQDHNLLGRVVSLQMSEKIFVGAVDTATRLVQIARNDGERCQNLVVLAQAKAGAGSVSDAVAHLAEAVVLEGVHGRARSEVGLLAREEEHWESYSTALRAQMERHAMTPEQSSPLFLEISKVQHSRLARADLAMTTLIEGLRISSSDDALRFELAKRLREAGRPSDAIEQFQYLLMDAVERADAWRALAETYNIVGRGREADMAMCAVRVLDQGTPAERSAVETWRPHQPKLAPGSLLPSRLTELFIAREQQEPAAQLLLAMSEGLGKIRQPDLGRHGVSSRDKLPQRSEHPLRMLVDGMAPMFGIEEYEVYLHRMQGRPIVIENTTRPSILLPAWLIDQSRAKQVFMVTRALLNLARGVYPVDLLSPRDIDVLLAAAGRSVVPGFGERVSNREILDDRQRLIQRGLPRRRRRAFEIAAEAYTRSRPIDMSTFVQWVQQTSRRVALIVADDLVGSFELLARTEEVPGPVGEKLAASSPVAADLLRVWVSKPAAALRQSWGYLTPAADPRRRPQA